MSESAPRVRGRPTYVAADVAAEIAFRVYIQRLEPPEEYATVMLNPERAEQFRRNSVSYVPTIRSIAKALIDLGLIERDAMMALKTE